jgi:hypothetical protein
MGEGCCAEMPVGGVGRLLHQARGWPGQAKGHGGPPGTSRRAWRPAGRARAAGVVACRHEPQGMAACPPGAGGLWGPRVRAGRGVVALVVRVGGGRALWCGR